MIQEAETLSGSGTAGGVTALASSFLASSLAGAGAGAAGAGTGLTVSAGLGCGAVLTALGGVETAAFFGTVRDAATRPDCLFRLTGLEEESSCGKVTGGMTADSRARTTGRRL